jgi:hypothetical protein
MGLQCPKDICHIVVSQDWCSFVHLQFQESKLKNYKHHCFSMRWQEVAYPGVRLPLHNSQWTHMCLCDINNIHKFKQLQNLSNFLFSFIMNILKHI